MSIHPRCLLQTLIGRGRADKKKPRPQTRKGHLVLQHALSVIADHVPGLPHSFEFWHRAPSATLVAATLSKPLSRECLFNPLSERLSTLPGSGVYVAREPHLPRNESVSHCRARGAPWQCSGQKYTLRRFPCNPKTWEEYSTAIVSEAQHALGGPLRSLHVYNRIVP